MLLNFARPGRPVADVRDARDSDAAFYDATIHDAWRLALCLHHADRVRAADAVVDAYLATTRTGRRDRTALLACLVHQGRPAAQTAPSAEDATGVVVPLRRRRPQEPAPA